MLVYRRIIPNIREFKKTTTATGTGTGRPIFQIIFQYYRVSEIQSSETPGAAKPGRLEIFGREIFLAASLLQARLKKEKVDIIIEIPQGRVDV